MKRTLIPIACCAAALLATNVTAQDQSQSSSSGSSQPGQSSSGQQSPELQQANAQEFFRSSALVGKNVQDSKGTKIGEIKDVAFNQQGEVFAFVNVGNSKWAVVPWQVIQPATAKGSGNVTVNATAQQMKAGPAVSKDQWGSLNNPQFVQGCYTYYNVQPPTATGGASTPGGSSQGQGQSQGAATQPSTNSSPETTNSDSSATNSTAK